MDALKRSVERAWAAHLAADVAVSVPVYASRRDEEAEPPYVVCTVAKMEETVARANAYRVELDVVLVAHMDESTVAEHSAQWQAVKAAVDSVPSQGEDADEGVRFYGWAQVASAPAKDAQYFADVLTLVLGAGQIPILTSGVVDRAGNQLITRTLDTIIPR